MSRLLCIVAALVAPIMLFAQSPPAQPKATSAQKAAPAMDCDSHLEPNMRDASCICAIYPFWHDDEYTTFLYSAEMTEAAKSCAVTDSSYFFESEMIYPRSCRIEGCEGCCADCNRFIEIKKDSPVLPPFAGLKMPIDDLDPATRQIPEYVNHPDTNSEDTRSEPRLGVVNTQEYYARVSIPAILLADGSTTPARPNVYVKLSVLRIDPSKINAPKPTGRDADVRERIVTVGYEVKYNRHRNYTNLAPATPVARAKRPGEKVKPEVDSPFVVQVRHGLVPFLVLLKGK